MNRAQKILKILLVSMITSTGSLLNLQRLAAGGWMGQGGFRFFVFLLGVFCLQTKDTLGLVVISDLFLLFVRTLEEEGMEDGERLMAIVDRAVSRRRFC